MIGIVRIALTRPLTFIVMAILIAIIGTMAAVRTPVDIFPNIRIPVIAVAWTYAGLPPEDMSSRVITPYERVLTTTVNDIDHIESQSLQGIGVVKIFFQPGVDIRTATAQVTSVSQTMLRQLPPGTNPPLILNYSASTVPIIQLALSGKGLSEQQSVRYRPEPDPPAARHRAGLAMPYPSGGKQRQVQIDLDPRALQAKGLSAQDVGNAVAAQNQINPAGFVEDRPDAIQRPAQQRAELDRGAERPSGEGGQRRDNLYARRGASCATATARRPTSSTSSGNRSVLLTC
ncbi:MAG: efflux RND transporter permease subunit [Candidatus Sphingomonas colombiensis]|nr:efflux RND transporter permease subunit [Sphingomonas sp.]WEK44806.1 MAG: efflux RND transporter permease subunit [Sphingomonas sp.]